MRYNIGMKEGQEGVVRYRPRTTEQRKDRRFRFSQVRHMGNEGHPLPIKIRVNMNVHDAIAMAGDCDVVSSIILCELRQNLTVIETSIAMEKIEEAKKKLNAMLIKESKTGETPKDVFDRKKQHLRAFQAEAQEPAKKVSNYAYKFGYASAYNAFNRLPTGHDFPKFPKDTEIQEMPQWQRDIMETAGFHTQWCALSALGEKDFEYQNNPFSSILELVSLGVKDFKIPENN